MINEYRFTRGMSAVMAPENLPDDVAALIQDMYLDTDGKYKSIGKVTENESPVIPENFVSLYEWHPAVMPEEWDSTQSRLLLIGFFADGRVKLGCYTDTDVFSWIDVESYNAQGIVRVTSDSIMFCWVDGRDNNSAKRIMIDSDGSIKTGVIGILAPKRQPILMDIITSTESNIGTGLPTGSTLTYAYCYVNKLGERSNPSPLLTIDSYQWQQKGYFGDDSTYMIGDRTGSIKDVSLSVAIDNENADKIELYRGTCLYNESVLPLETMKLVAISSVNRGAEYCSIHDSNFGSGTVISYDNGLAPKGDDIALITGTTFIANANMQIALIEADIHRITLTNKNGYNYVNQWIRIDMHDQVSKRNGEAYIDLDWSSVTMSKVRILANDMTSSLEVRYYNPLETEMADLGNTITEYTARMMAWIKVPYLAAYNETDIYLAIFPGTVPEEYAEMIRIDTADIAGLRAGIKELWDQRNTQCPVRTQLHLISQNAQRGTSDLPESIKQKINLRANKANLYFKPDRYVNFGAEDANLYDEAVLALPEATGDEGNVILSDIVTFSTSGMGEGTYYTYEADEISCPSKGWASMYYHLYKLNAVNSSRNLFELKNGDTTTISIKCETAIGGHMELSATARLEDGFSSEISAGVLYLGDDISAVRMHIFISWEYQYGAGAPGDLRAVVRVMYSEYSDTSSTWSTLKYAGTIEFGNSAEEVISWDEITAKYLACSENILYTGNYNLSADGYYTAKHQALAAIRNTALFPSEVIGTGSRYLADGSDVMRVYNDNVIFTHIQDNSQDSDNVGIIHWGKYGNMGSLNIANVSEEILRIVPEKSYAPIEAHNTIHVFTARRKLRLTLNPSGSVSTIVDFEHIGLANSNAVAVVPGGIAWLDSRLGLYLSSGNELNNISREWVPIDSDAVMYYDKHKNWLWVAYEYQIEASTYKAIYIYNLNNQTWTSTSQLHIPQQAIEVGDDILYVNSLLELPCFVLDTMQATGCFLRTKTYDDHIGIKRIRVQGTTNEQGTIKAITSGYNATAATVTISAKAGEKVSAPGLRAPRIAYELYYNVISKLEIERKNNDGLV